MLLKFSLLRRRALCVLLMGLAGLGGAAAAPSTSFTVSGAVLQPRTYDAAALAAISTTTQTVTFLSGSTSQTHTYTGASFWDVLNASSPALGSNKNDVLNGIVLATGSDGYRVVFSLGELNPGFGKRPDLVAGAETINGVSQPLTADGVARITAPGDVKGGRYVSNLISLDVRVSGSAAAGIGGGTSTSFAVSGAVRSAGSFDLAALQALTPTTETVNGVSYTGVSFWDFLSTTVGLSLDAAVKNDVLNKYVVATGSDGYKAVFSLGELSSDFGHETALIAYQMDGQALGSKGFARLVVPGDDKAGRWVSNLVSLEVLSAAAAPVPEPAQWALMAAGLLALGVAKAERRRR